MTDRNAIFVNVSREYFKYFYVFNKSLQQNYPDYPSLIVLWQGLSKDQLAYLESVPRTHNRDVDTIDFQAGPAMIGREHDDPKIYYARYLIFSDLFNDYDKILYLDTDTTILKPLDTLFEKTKFTIFQEAYNGEFPIIRTNIEEAALKRLVQEDRLAGFPEVAANAGVFLAPRSIRTTESFRKLMAIKERYRPYLIWGDQSAMNLWMLENKIGKEIDYRFNFQPLLFDQRRARDAFKDVHIFHFNGMVRTPYLALLMNMARVCWTVPFAGRWSYYLFHRFFFSQNTVRFRSLNFFLNWLHRRF